jgi:predicted tellurium resistance membrane protein TerC
MSFIEVFSKPENLVSLLTLTGMEIILGVDNVIFISIVTGRLPYKQQGKARMIGLFFALFIRIGLLAFISHLAGMIYPLFTVMGKGFSARDLIMLGGGLFLMFKTTMEIFNKLEGEADHPDKSKKNALTAIILQVILIDIVFSFDSIVTAIGLSNEVWIMIGAVILSMFVMLIFSAAVSKFINKHPSMKMLALSFLLMIGAMLVGEGFGQHIEKGYIYFAMGFSLSVEFLKIIVNKRSNKPVKLKDNLNP